MQYQWVRSLKQECWIRAPRKRPSLCSPRYAGFGFLLSEIGTMGCWHICEIKPWRSSHQDSVICFSQSKNLEWFALSLSLSLHDSVRCFLKFVLPCFVGTLTDCRKIANRHWAVGEVLGQMTWVLNTYGRMHVWTHSISSHVVSWRDQTWWWRNADGRTELMPCWMSVLSPRH